MFAISFVLCLAVLYNDQLFTLKCVHSETLLPSDMLAQHVRKTSLYQAYPSLNSVHFV